VQAQWKELGINSTLKQQEWAQYLEFLGPPPNYAVDVYRLGWIYDFPDAINGLELWTCDSGNNNTNYCDKDFDALVAQARQTPDDTARYELYAQMEAEAVRAGRRAADHPIYWYTFPNLEKLSIKDTFNISPLDQFDLTKVVVKG
jgi:ABC-type transport system substrate-binding protein